MCPDQDVLSAYLDGELPDRWRSTVDRHVRDCAACTARLAGLRTLSRALTAQDAPGVADAMDRVRASLSVATRSVRAAKWRIISVPVPVALAAAALLVVMSGALVYTLTRPSWQPFSASRVLEADEAAVARLLDRLNADAGQRTVVFEIPADYHFGTFGEPEALPTPLRSAE